VHAGRARQKKKSRAPLISSSCSLLGLRSRKVVDNSSQPIEGPVFSIAVSIERKKKSTNTKCASICGVDRFDPKKRFLMHKIGQAQPIAIKNKSGNGQIQKKLSNNRVGWRRQTAIKTAFFPRTGETGRIYPSPS